MLGLSSLLSPIANIAGTWLQGKMDKQKENRKIITKRYRDKKRNYIKNLEKENFEIFFSSFFLSFG